MHDAFCLKNILADAFFRYKMTIRAQILGPTKLHKSLANLIFSLDRLLYLQVMV